MNFKLRVGFGLASLVLFVCIFVNFIAFLFGDFDQSMIFFSIVMVLTAFIGGLLVKDSN